MFVCEEGPAHDNLQTIKMFQNPKHLISWYEKAYHSLDREDRAAILNGGELFYRFRDKFVRVRKIK